MPKKIDSALREPAEAHKANILAALGLTSTADLVRYAVRHRIISV